MTTTQQAGAEIALPSDAPAPQTISQRIVALETQFATAAPRGLEAQQIVRDALTLIAKTPKLGDCDPASVIGGLMTMAQLGLRPGVLGHGWLLPFMNKNAKVVEVTPGGGRRTVTRARLEAQLIIGYQGLVTLAYRSNLVDKITARTVRERDLFELEYGLNERLVHRPAMGDRGAPVGYYATVKLRGASESMFHFMTHAEVEVYRDRYAMARSGGVIVGPWRDQFEDMAKKTQIRQLSKYVPKGTDLATALAADDTVRLDANPIADVVHVSHHIERDQASDTVHVDLDDVPTDEPPLDEPPAG